MDVDGGESPDETPDHLPTGMSALLRGTDKYFVVAFCDTGQFVENNLKNIHLAANGC